MHLIIFVDYIKLKSQASHGLCSLVVRVLTATLKPSFRVSCFQNLAIKLFCKLVCLTKNDSKVVTCSKQMIFLEDPKAAKSH